jgi:3-dehydroquinate dehydratase-2
MKFQILVLNGPNLNLLGKRQTDIYGAQTLEQINSTLRDLAVELGAEVQFFQSNSESGLIDALHDASVWANGVLFNPGAYTHTSIALLDAITAIELPVVEVHISNVYAREGFRRNSMIAPACVGTVAGFGSHSYALALRALVNQTWAD